MPLFGFGRSRVYDRDPLVGGGGRFLLSPPSFGLFLLSVAFAILALLIRYTEIRVPIVNASYVFELLLIAYGALLIGVLVGRRY